MKQRMITGDFWLSKKVILAGLLNGFLLNLFGWVGNAILLNKEWRIAEEQIGQVNPANFSGISRELLSLMPDFIYGYLMIVIYQYVAHAEGFTYRSKILTIIIGFFLTLFTTYLGIVSANLIPLKISVLSTLWGFVTFFPAFFLTLLVLRFDR